MLLAESHEIIQTNKELQNNNDLGLDNLTARTLKEIAGKIAQLLGTIFNNGFAMGYFSQSLNITVVIPRMAHANAFKITTRFHWFQILQKHLKE